MATVISHCRRLREYASAVAVVAVAACGRSHLGTVAPAPESAAGARQRCAKLEPPVAPPDSLVIAVTEPLDVRDAPLPRNDAEHLIFPDIYTPDVSVPCGTAHAGGERVTYTASLPPMRTEGHAGDQPWPAGLGPYAVTGDDGHVLRLAPHTGWQGPRLIIRRIGPREARDALDAGADVVVSSDAATRAYAEQRPDLAVVALPWNRIYVLLLPTRDSVPANPWGSEAAMLRAGLARDAISIDATSVTPDQWWLNLTACDSAFSTPDAENRSSGGAKPSSGRLVYSEADDVARALAARLVALAAGNSGELAAVTPTLAADRTLRTQGLLDGQMAARLAAGSDAGYVLALPARADTPCQGAASLVSRAPWLSRADSVEIVPLVATRSQLIVRRGAAGVAIDSAGGVHLLPLPQHEP